LITAVGIDDSLVNTLLEQVFDNRRLLVTLLADGGTLACGQLPVVLEERADAASSRSINSSWIA